MEKYPSIKTVWTRNPENKYKTLIEGQWATPELEYLRNAIWVWTEKIDGTNIRVMWSIIEDKLTREFRGRTDKAQVPTFLLDKLEGLFPLPLMYKIFGNEPIEVCLYGEGYGAKIQKGGGNYIPDGVSFILFDVMVNGCFLRREDVNDIAAKLEIDAVPIIMDGTLLEAIRAVQKKPRSWINSAHEMEGLVMRPKVELLNRRGQRIITKVKAKDFQ